ncbi:MULTISPECIES: serine/threonine-protein kinase [unclassified Arthrobacter]|uniref:serine/threonine-protein kinase n=1 Tax=unclassified Arthrobacter TaxID=235627 RepID=UPI001490E0B8|nr:MULTISPECIES: serine/threonine-protein kinase [unclassified Arthrobacter]MBE0009095.1 serine/threonine protein kinase [Arthrobacter sp. AET 35A]NOJ62775.1 serine/threonine protein kinase [Arthrobacter sp. 147(2020)]
MSTQSLADGRYLLGSVVGVGGMAEVYHARDTRLGRDVAVKLFRPGAADGVSRGSDEARLLAGLHHPGLVRVLDMDSSSTSSGSTYLVMELVEGPDLGALLADGPLPADAVRSAGWDVARTLAYIHQRGILHRDIKPSNILTRTTDPDSGVFGYLLTDFGIARFYDAARQTATGQTIGTAAYLSPEQARGGTVGTPTDIYSLGLVLLECLTGARAYPGTSLETAVARLHRPPAIPAGLGPAWQSLLSRMTADNPDDRPTAGAVAAEFAQWKEPEPRTEVLRADTPVARPFQLSLPDEPARQPAPTTVLATGPAVTETQSSAGLWPADDSRGTALGTRTLPTGDEPRHDRSGRAPSTHGQAGGSRSGTSRPGRRRTWLVGVLAAAAVVVVGLVVILGLNLGGQAPMEELPSVPGTTGELLNELYERVQP